MPQENPTLSNQKKSKPTGFSNAGHSIGQIEWKRVSKNPIRKKKKEKYTLQI